MFPVFKITAISKKTMSRVELFTWTREPEAGIDRAKKEAKIFGRFNELMDYAAEICEGEINYGY
jgi:hypothetical protein